MISKELKNDFREMIFGTFAAAFEDLIYSWEKNISFGNGHFQKWVEIIFFKKMLHNLQKSDLKKEFFEKFLLRKSFTFQIWKVSVSLTKL